MLPLVCYWSCLTDKLLTDVGLGLNNIEVNSLAFVDNLAAPKEGMAKYPQYSNMFATLLRVNTDKCYSF